MTNSRRKITLAKLRRLDVRDVWQSESSSFTPWLAEAENIALLGQAIGIELEVVQTEKAVGPFRADIVCKDLSAGPNDHLVLIENQLERSDHAHLGQLLTYASGLGAVTIVWISPKFTEEHRTAIEWLNGITSEAFLFFAVEIELWAISDSAPAPKFNIVAKPNAWSRSVKAAIKKIDAADSDSARRRTEYWTEFLATLKLAVPFDRMPSANSLGNLRFSLDGQRLWITVYASASLGRIGVFATIRDPYSPLLWRSRRAIKADFDIHVEMELVDGEMRIGIAESSNVIDRADWKRQHGWLASRLNRFLQVIGSHVNHQK